MLGALMLNRVCRHVDSANIVTKHDGGPRERSMKLLQELSEPSRLGNGVGDGTVLRFSAGAGDGMLALGGPRHQVVAKEDTVARGRTPCVGAACPVRIRVRDQRISGRWHELEAVAEGALDVAKNTLDQREMLVSRIVHVKADLLHGVRDVWTCERQVLQGTGETAIFRRIGDGRASGGG